MNRALQSLRKPQRGVGLVEVLVAVLVVAFGMLGIVSLQLFTIKNNQSSLERSMAVTQSHSIIDAMRADRTSAMNDLFDIGLDAANPSGTTFPEVSIATWRANLRTAIGEGATGAVSCSGAVCTVTVRWDDSRATDAVSRSSVGGTHQVETMVQL